MISPEVQLCSILHPLIERLSPRRTLIINAGPTDYAATDVLSDSLIVRVEPGQNAGKPSVHCMARELPFEDGAFKLVMVSDVFGTCEGGDIRELARVLTGGGNLVIIGRGRFGSSPGDEHLKIHSLDSKSICRILRQQGFQIRHCEGFGFRGRRAHWAKSWQMPALPLADLIMIRAEYTQNNPILTPINFGQANLSREAI